MHLTRHLALLSLLSLIGCRRLPNGPGTTQDSGVPHEHEGGGTGPAGDSGGGTGDSAGDSGGVDSADTGSVQRGEGKVVVIVMDGARFQETLSDFPSSATGTYPSEDFLPEVWKELLPQAVISAPAWNLTSTITTPAHATLLEGLREPFANYPVDADYPDEPAEPGPYRPDYPNLIELLHSHYGDATGNYAIVANTNFLSAFTYSRYPDMGPDVGGVFVAVVDDEGKPRKDPPVLDTVRNQLKNHPTRFLIANLHEMDRRGHIGDEDDYLDAVRTADEPIVDLWNFIQSEPDYADQTWMLIVADHGRHTNADTDPPWRHHGCSCNGCREVPFILLGPGVKAGAAVTSPVLLEDIAPTLGALLGIEVPWADGMVRDDLFEEPTGMSSRAGLAGLAVSDGLRVELTYTQDLDHRKALKVNGEVLSSESAIEVGQPALATWDGQALLCFPELTLRPDDLKSPWQLRCFVSDDGGESFTQIDPPVREVGPYWRGRMRALDHGVLLAFAYNPNGLAFAGSRENNSGTISLDLAYWDGYDWEHDRVEGNFGFSLDADLLVRGNELLVAAGAGQANAEARYSRDVLLVDASATTHRFRGEPRWSSLAELLYDDPPYWRLEHPALWTDEEGERVWLACTAAADETRVDAALAATEDGGRSWSEARILELPGSLLPSPGPVWLGDEPVFPVLDENGIVKLCRGGREAEIECVSTGSPRLSSVLVDGETLYAVVDTSVAHWSSRHWSLEDFGVRED